MTENATLAYPCPACRAPADLAAGCSGCGRAPDPDAAEVVRLNGLVAELVAREQRYREAYLAAAAQLTELRARRGAVAERVRASLGVRPQVPPAPPPAPPPASPPASPLAPPSPAAMPDRPDSSARGIQTLLFVIGGLLLGIGAIVFTVVAWTTFGVAGQAAILATVTALALAAPPVARWRRLPGTAETFAVVGMLLVLMDWYAAWRADLAGGLPGATWAGLAAEATAAVAYLYSRWTRLASPRLAALVLAQPALPLLAVEPGRALPDPVSWLAGAGYLAAVLAAGNLALRWRLGGAGPAPRVVAWVATGGWLGAAVLASVVALFAADGPGLAAVAGGGLLAGGAVLGGVARLTGTGGWVTAAAAGAVLAVALAAGRVAALAWPELALVAVAAVATGAAVPALVEGRLPGQLRRGWRIGGLVAVGAVAGYATVLALWAGATATWRAQSHPGSLAIGGAYDWQLLVALGLVTGALAGLVPAGRRHLPVVGGVALLTLAAPAALALPWWTPVAAGLLAAAGLAVATARAGTGRNAVVAAGTAAGLAGHALVVGSAAMVTLAAGLGALLPLGVLIAYLARPRAGGGAPPAQVVVGQAALVVGLVAWPGAVAAGLAAGGVSAPWPGRAALAASAALLLGVVVARYAAPGHLRVAAAAVHVATPVAIFAGLAEGLTQGIGAVAAYAGGAALVLAVLGLVRAPAERDGWLAARVPVAVVTLLVAAPQVAMVLAGPYSWLGHGWAGEPAGTGTVAGGWPAAGWSPGAALGLVLLAAAAGVAGRVVAGSWPVGAGWALLAAPVPVLVGLAELGAPWPAGPAASLGFGAVAVLAAALRGSGGRASLALGGYGLVLAGAGLAGAVPARWSTPAALGVAVTVAAVVGVAGRARGARVAGWVGGVTFAVLLAIAATLAAGLPWPAVPFAVLGVCAAALTATWWLRHPETAGTEAAAHAGALVALLLSAGSAARAATVAALWGVAVGVRALRPGEPAAGRVGRAVAAAGCELLAWWLLLASRQVATIEAYTLPAALVALAVGWWVLRSRPQMGSWTGYGPALAAAALPSLYLVLVDPVPLRRLVLGAAAVAVVVAGARRRRQAPVVVGGAVAGLVAIRELGLVWQLLDTWIPLTVAGLLLVALAASYERRRRDLGRLRAALGRMS